MSRHDGGIEKSAREITYRNENRLPCSEMTNRNSLLREVTTGEISDNIIININGHSSGIRNNR